MGTMRGITGEQNGVYFGYPLYDLVNEKLIPFDQIGEGDLLYPAHRVLKGRRGIRETPVLKDLEVSKESRAIMVKKGLKGTKALRARQGKLALKALRGQ